MNPAAAPSAPLTLLDLFCDEEMMEYTKDERLNAIGPSLDEFYFSESYVVENFDMEVTKDELLKAIGPSYFYMELSEFQSSPLCEVCGLFHSGTCPPTHLCDKCGMFVGNLHRCLPIHRCPEHSLCPHNENLCQCFKCWGQPAQCPYYYE